MSTTNQGNEASEAIRQFVKNYFREQQGKGVNLAQLAKVLGRHVGKSKGFSRPTMTEIQKDRRGVGADMRRAIAKELFGGSYDKLEQTALIWWAENKERINAMQRGKYSTVEKLYENRGEALDRLEGIVETEAIEYVRKIRLADKPDLPILEWIRLTVEEHDRLSYGIVPTRSHPSKPAKPLPPGPKK